MVKIFPITKIEFCGSYNRAFYDVSFCFTVDPINQETSGWKGDIKIVDKRLYIKGQYIPIHESLVGCAYNQFCKIVQPDYKYTYIYFKILSDGKFLIRYKRHNNTLALVLNSLNDFGSGENWKCPYWDDELREQYRD